MISFENLFTGEKKGSVAQSSPLDFIKSLKSAHKAQEGWTEMTVDQRVLALERVGTWISENRESIATDLAQVQGLSKKFVLQNEVIPAANCFLKIKESLDLLTKKQEMEPEFRPFPLGLITILPPQYFSFRFLAEKISEGLVAGNVFFVKPSELNPMAGELLKTGFQGFPESVVQFFHGDQELGQIMTSHPAVQGVILAGKPTEIEKMARELAGSWKRIQFFSGSHNSALILSDVDLDQVVGPLLESSFRGMGQLNWNIQNILVLESVLPEFEKKFLAALENTKFAVDEADSALLGPIHSSERARIQTLWNQIKSENGKILRPSEIPPEGVLQVPPLLARDLSHCSLLQQEWLGAPVLLISPVKYAYDMVKWCNTSYFGQLAQIFGTPEKRDKFGSQLEVGSVVGPGWISELKKWPVGIKQSSMGEMDSWAFGRFFSQNRSIHRSEI